MSVSDFKLPAVDDDGNNGFTVTHRVIGDSI